MITVRSIDKRLSRVMAPMTIVAITLFLSGCSGRHPSQKDDTEMMTVDVALPAVDSLTIRKSFPAYLSANKSVDVVARVNGYVVAKHFTDGQYVKKGQLLYSIEDTQYADAVRQAEAQLQTARSQADYSSRQYQAMRKALESDAVSEMEVVQAQNSRNEAEASIKNAEAALRTARTNLGYCTIRALSDGHIEASKVDVGDFVGGGASPVVLTTIYEDSSLNAVFSVNDSRYLDILREKQSTKGLFDSIPVEFTEALPHRYSGKLDYIAPNIDRSTGTMTLKVRLENPYGELKNGMYATVKIPIDTDSNALLVKDSAISTDQRGKYLYVVNDSDRVVYTPIEVGELYADTLRIVTSGITPQSRYVTKALLKVRNGMPVKPVLTK